MEFVVPTDVMPALIGLRGQKHKDTEQRTNTVISFKKLSNCLTLVSVHGKSHNCELAKKLLQMASGHYLASLKNDDCDDLQVPGIDHARQDIKTFLTEILNS